MHAVIGVIYVLPRHEAFPQNAIKVCAKQGTSLLIAITLCYYCSEHML